MGRRVELPDPDAIVAAYRAGRTVPELVDATPGATYGRVWRLLAARVPPGERRRHRSQVVSASARRQYAAGREPWSKDRGEGGTAPARPVWSDRAGEHWPDLSAAAAAVGVPRSTLAAAVKEGRPCADRAWHTVPPRWWIEAAAAAELRRAAAIKVRPGRLGMCGQPGPSWRGCEQRWAERKAVTA